MPEVLFDLTGQRHSGLGQADGTTRRLAGTAMARRARSLHAAWTEVRHILELDCDQFISHFRTTMQAGMTTANYCTKPVLVSARHGTAFPVKNTFIYFSDGDESGGGAPFSATEKTFSASTQMGSSDDESGAQLFDIFDLKAVVGVQTVQSYDSASESLIGIAICSRVETPAHFFMEMSANEIKYATVAKLEDRPHLGSQSQFCYAGTASLPAPGGEDDDLWMTILASWAIWRPCQLFRCRVPCVKANDPAMSFDAGEVLIFKRFDRDGHGMFVRLDERLRYEEEGRKRQWIYFYRQDLQSLFQPIGFRANQPSAKP